VLVHRYPYSATAHLDKALGAEFRMFSNDIMETHLTEKARVTYKTCYSPKGSPAQLILQFISGCFLPVVRLEQTGVRYLFPE